MSAGPHSDTLSERQTRRRNGRFSSTGDSGAQSWTPAPGLGAGFRMLRVS